MCCSLYLSYLRRRRGGRCGSAVFQVNHATSLFFGGLFSRELGDAQKQDYRLSLFLFFLFHILFNLSSSFQDCDRRRLHIFFWNSLDFLNPFTVLPPPPALGCGEQLAPSPDQSGSSDARRCGLFSKRTLRFVSRRQNLCAHKEQQYFSPRNDIFRSLLLPLVQVPCHDLASFILYIERRCFQRFLFRFYYFMFCVTLSVTT